MNQLATPFLLFAVASADSTALRGVPSLADTLATLRGRVVFASDRRPVAYANIILIGTRRGAMTDDTGGFRITKVPSGPRVIRIQSAGFQPLERRLDIMTGSIDLGEIEVPWVFPQPPAPIVYRGRARAADLVATLRPTAERFRVGDAATFEARIVNRGRTEVVLVSSVDASDAWASPRVHVEIVGPDSGFLAPVVLRCGNNNGVTPQDFWRLEPGGELDPWANGWMDSKLRRGRFHRPGLYTATLHYDTTSRDVRKWIGNFCANCTAPTSLIELLEQVPAVHLTATTEFEVLP